MTSFTSARHLVRTARRRKLLMQIASGAIHTIAALLIIFAAAGLFAAFLKAHPALRLTFASICAAAAAIIFVRQLLFPAMRRTSDHLIAGQIDAACKLDNVVVNSLQLQQHLQSTRRQDEGDLFSPHLISAYLAAARTQIARVGHQAMSRVAPIDPVVNSAVLCVAALFLSCVAFLLRPSLAHDAVSVFFLKRCDEIAEPTDGITVGDICVTLSYPAYASKPPETLENTTGDIHALKGTEIAISAVASPPVRSATLVINGATRLPVRCLDKNRMQANFSLLEPGTYHFEFVDEQGSPTRSSRNFSLSVQEDYPPQIKVLWPAKEMTVARKDSVPIAFTANDDFGLVTVKLLASIEGREEARVIAQYSPAVEEVRGSYDWNLSDVTPDGANRITYRLEAADSDSISGPKKGVSETRVINIYDERKHHDMITAAQEELLRQLLHLLAPDLTCPIAPHARTVDEDVALVNEKVLEQGGEVMEMYEQILAAMKEDKLANYAVYCAISEMKNALDHALGARASVWRGLARAQLPLLAPLAEAQSGQIESVECQILALNKFITREKLQSTNAAARQLASLNDELSKLLSGADGDIDLDRLRQLIREIDQKLAPILSKLARLAKEAPYYEFLNPDAVRAPDSILQRLEDALRAGDAAAAQRLANELTNSLAQFMAQLDAWASSFGSEAFGSALVDIERLSQQVGELHDDQEALLQETKSVKDAVQKRTRTGMKHRIEEFFARQQERLNAIREDLGAMQAELAKSNGLADFRRKEAQLSQADAKRREKIREILPQSRDDFREFDMLLERIGMESDALRRQLERLSAFGGFARVQEEIPQRVNQLQLLRETLRAGDIQESLNVAEGLTSKLRLWEKQMHAPASSPGAETLRKQVSGRATSAAERSTEIRDDLRALEEWADSYQRQRLTGEDKQRIKHIEHTQNLLRGRTSQLRREIENLIPRNPLLDSGVPENLRLADHHMRKAAAELSQQTAGRAVLQERESLGRIADAAATLQKARERIMKGMMGPGMPMPFRTMASEGFLGRPYRNVALPSRDEYKVPEAFRREILDAMKGHTPERYRQLNRRYYKSLID